MPKKLVIFISHAARVHAQCSASLQDVLCPGSPVNACIKGSSADTCWSKSLSDSSAALQFIAHGLLFPTFSRFPKAAGVYCTVWRSHLPNTRKSAWPDWLLHHVAENVFTLFCQTMASWAKYSEALGSWPSFYFTLELTATYLLFGRTSTGVYLDSNLALFCCLFLFSIFFFMHK